MWPIDRVACDKGWEPSRPTEYTGATPSLDFTMPARLFFGTFCFADAVATTVQVSCGASGVAVKLGDGARYVDLGAVIFGIQLVQRQVHRR